MPQWGSLYVLLDAAMIGLLGSTMYRFVDLFEPNRTFAQILKVLVVVTGALALLAQAPT